jgi:CubicO group peptidase (beta-lactamase class C family)
VRGGTFEDIRKRFFEKKRAKNFWFLWVSGVRRARPGYKEKIICSGEEMIVNQDALKAVIDNAVATGAAPGIAGAVTDGQGTIFEYCAGTTAAGGGVPVTANTLFWIASMTKAITSVAAMQLVEQGTLTLDEPIGLLLPDLAHPQILENGTLRPAVQKMTLRHLLTHTAGFTYLFANAGLADYVAAQGLEASPGKRASIKMPILFEPGTRWEYGISTDWVGLAVEAASGLTLDVYFEKYITGPLGMVDTVFLPDAGQQARRMQVHQRMPDNTLAALPPAPVARPEFFSGGGGLNSTLADYTKFVRIFLNGGGGVISPKTVAEMSRNQIEDLRAGVIPSANPAVIAETDFYPGMDSKWGLGFLLNPERGRFGRAAGSLTWAGLPNTYFWIDPATSIAAVLLMQTLPSGDPASVKTLCGFEAAVYAAKR